MSAARKDKKGDDQRTLEQKGFEALGRFSHKGGKPLRPLIDRLFARRVTGLHLDRDWNHDADWARIQQEPMRARWLLYAMVLVVIALIVWASFGKIDEVTRGTGRVVPASQLQTLSSLDGGIVQEILAREGERVDRGQLLMRIDPTRFVANFRENRVQAFALQARITRLEALIKDVPFEPSDELQQNAPEIVADERQLYQNLRQETSQEIAILNEQLSQRRDELRETQSRVATARQSLNLASQELSMTRPMLDTGAVSEVEVLRLEREVSNARGELNQASARVDQLQSAIEEAQSKIDEARSERVSDWRTELAQARGELAALNESGTGLENRVTTAELRSPVDGIVQSVNINTVGGVAQPGQDIIEIVPTDEQLLVEARIAPRDVAFLHPGQRAIIKLTAYDFSLYGGFEAELVNISPDTVTDEDGNTFYRVRVRSEEGAFEKDLTVIPGMIAQVDIVTGKRTVMQYLLKPVLRAWRDSLGER
ncbi:HlyD family type I secretion periplasmic adaptor subunit [Kushneria aurantia]|uniref:Membrane fusion protein (MFP) family protein n=1 Tax=Kushneria aurantia TaxID=504092 RepID=A0ABV6G712_9GAMM|nr:HlyD family type I secretion periplasmic adaptor subunit [Kushneria aurantia]